MKGCVKRLKPEGEVLMVSSLRTFCSNYSALKNSLIRILSNTMEQKRRTRACLYYADGLISDFIFYERAKAYAI